MTKFQSGYVPLLFSYLTIVKQIHSGYASDGPCLNVPFLQYLLNVFDYFQVISNALTSDLGK